VRWLLERVITIWVIFASFSAGVVLIARANPAPDKLAALGFGMCDGEPCWRGVRWGMDWAEVKRELHDFRDHGQYLELLIDSIDIDRIALGPSANGEKLEMITVGYKSQYPRSVTAGGIVLRYGIPCGARVQYSGGQAVEMILFYPEVAITLRDPSGDPSDPHQLGIDIDSSAYIFFDMTGRSPCDSSADDPWRDFTFADVYLSRQQRMSPTSVKP
jgi:hypothetical protein